jgi:F0F1-type ATP synthase alpha subunit
MDEKSLAVALEDTLAESTIDIISDIAEVGLDAVLDDGLLKDIPIISTAVSLFKIGKTIHDRVYVKQLGVFIDEIKKHTVNEEKRQKYINKIRENEAFRNKELEYLLAIIARYIGYEKPRMLAKNVSGIFGRKNILG